MTLYYVVMNLPSMNVFAFALGIGGMLLLHLAKKANTKFCPKIALPEQLILLILATTLVWLLGADEDDSPLRLPVVGQVGSDFKSVGNLCAHATTNRYIYVPWITHAGALRATTTKASGALTRFACEVAAAYASGESPISTQCIVR